MNELTLEQVQTMLQAAMDKVKELGLPSSVAIVDGGGHLRGFLRPERGRIANVTLAIQKAWTAIAMKRPTSMVYDMVQPGAFAYGINITEPRICPVTGAFPITNDGVDFLGGIGASGGTIEQDVEVCLAGLKASGFKIDFEDPLKKK